jgi:AraC-like DNA-binding protein
MSSSAKKRRKSKSKGGRPAIKLDWRLIRAACRLQGTAEEISSLIGCSSDTMDRATRREHGMSFAEFLRQKAPGARISLRRAQWKAAMQGNTTMQIWLGKQMLNQRDQRDTPVGDPQALARGVREMVGALFAVGPA